jgi:DNA-binding IclR family transcriptional regulator
MNKTRLQPSVRVLHKTLDILEAIKSNEEGMGLSELARSVQLPKATAYRIVATLEGRGYLDRREGGRCFIGKKLFDLQADGSFEHLLIRAAESPMHELLERFRETVNLGILDAGEVIVIDAMESPQAMRMASKIGNRRCLHATAIGKVLLAGLSDKEVARLIRLKGLERFTPTTFVTRSALARELRRVRKQGYAVDNRENEMDGRCVGAPIVGANDRVVAALSISGPVFRMDLARVNGLVRPLKEACATISAAIRTAA